MARHLLMRLQGPLMAFGGETIDNLGVIREFPAQSMLTGLIANALGWRREDATAHDRLQARLIFGARLDRRGSRITDFQTAGLGKDDQGWTTSGQPEGRAGGDGTYKGQHLRFRDYHADAAVLIAMRLEPAMEAPTLEHVAQALQHPARPLFLGRKPCLPAAPLFHGWFDAPNVLAVLQEVPSLTSCGDDARAMWPDGEGELGSARRVDLCDERNWASGVHGGWRPVREASLSAGGHP
jgi:CRISPR system Cascade subunit CasD